MKRAGKVIALVSISTGLVLAIVANWSVLVSWKLHRDNRPPGQVLVVNGKQMHIDCTGEGLPTVVLEAASSAPWSQWRLVQPQLSRLTRVCSYDRPGHGWSPATSDRRDAKAITRDLHQLLSVADVHGPFILAGLSAGGLYVREYAFEYPEQVAGVVLIESSSPEQIDELPGFKASYEEDKAQAQKQLWKRRLRVWSGWERLSGQCSVSESQTIQGMWVGQYAAMACRPGYVNTDELELPYFEDSSRQSARLKTLGQTPLLVISRDISFQADKESARGGSQLPVWEREQEQEKALSQRSWRVIAGKSGHIVPKDRPDVVVREISRLIDYLRGGAAPPFNSATQRQ